MEQPTTITAAEWHKVAEDVEAGRCEVWDNSMPEPAQIDEIYFYTEPNRVVYKINYADVQDIHDTVECKSGDVFEVRWLDTAQTERDKAAFAEFEAGYQAAEAGYAPSVNVIAAYVGELEATVASLQAELANARLDVDHYKALRDDMEKSMQTIGAALGMSGQFKEQYGTAQYEQAVQTIMEDHKIITDIRRLCMKARDEREDLQKQVNNLKGVEQIAQETYDKIWDAVYPAKNMGRWDYPAQIARHVGDKIDQLARKLAAAEAVLPCPDCEGDGVIAVGFDNDPNVYEAIEAECPRCKGTGKYTATPQPAPAGELVAAVKQVIALAPDVKPNVPYEISADTLSQPTMWHVKQILAAALKGE